MVEARLICCRCKYCKTVETVNVVILHIPQRHSPPVTCGYFTGKSYKMMLRQLSFQNIAGGTYWFILEDVFARQLRGAKSSTQGFIQDQIVASLTCLVHMYVMTHSYQYEPV